MTSQQTYVDVAFPVKGRRIAQDHGYHLYSALARHVPHLHQERSWAVHPVLGTRGSRGYLRLVSRSRVRLRVPNEQIGLVMPLAGQSLDIAGQRCRLGFPELHPLEPHSALRARLVVIRSSQRTCPATDDEKAFHASFHRQLGTYLQNESRLKNVDITLGPRRVLRIKGIVIVGYAVMLSNLYDHESIRIQELGLGGRRHMGAGVFTPLTADAQSGWRDGSVRMQDAS